MHMYSNNLSTIATISLLFKSEKFPARNSCSNNFNLPQSSPESDHKIFFDIPEAIIAGDLSNQSYNRFITVTFTSFLFIIKLHLLCKLLNYLLIFWIRITNIEIIICLCF